MTQRHRTRTYRRVKVKTPGGRLKTHYRKRKPKIAHCAYCKKELKGVPKNLPCKIRKLSKTERRPERPYGGNLCSGCMRKEIKQRFNISKQVPLDIGQVCVKLSGREAGKICVIIDKIDKSFVSIDGQTKRKKCNIMHLLPLEQKVKIKAKASHEDVVKELKKLKINVIKTKPKEKKTRLKKKRKSLTKEKKEKPKKKVTEPKKKVEEKPKNDKK